MELAGLRNVFTVCRRLVQLCTPSLVIFLHFNVYSHSGYNYKKKHGKYAIRVCLVIIYKSAGTLPLEPRKNYDCFSV